MTRPIIFSAPMIRALLEGRKSQTRRVCKEPWGLQEWVGGEWRPIPRYAPGDRLWVREAWRPQVDPEAWYCVEYRADGARIKPEIDSDHEGGRFEAMCDAIDPDWRDHGREPEPNPWRSPIHMPRWASRLTLIVTDVRVQRVQDISEDDARDEGPHQHPEWPEEYYGTWRDAFRALWDSLNARRGYGWEANPCVVAVSFRVERRNIDACEVAA